MSAEMEVKGPFEVPFRSTKDIKHIYPEDAKSFWQDVTHKAFMHKTGCYIFALKVSRGFTPWYVGKASAGFSNETFTDHKLGHMNRVFHEGKKGTPVLFFVVRKTSNRKVPDATLRDIEKVLTHYAHAKNPEIANIQNTKNQPDWSISGVIRAGRGKTTVTASKFKTMMGIS